MHTTSSTAFTINDPARVGHQGLLDTWIKFMVMLDEVLTQAPRFAQIDRFLVHAWDTSTSSDYNPTYGFPLKVSVRMTDQSERARGAEIQCIPIYRNEKTGETLAFLEATRYEGDVDQVLKDLSAGILNQLRTQAIGAVT